MRMTEQAFSGMKVLDLTHYIAGPFCTKLLADYGADVIKVEKPGGGDEARRVGPFPGDIPDPEKSGLYLYLNTNKRGITLNLKTKTGADIFKELVRQSDVLVENFSPRVMPSLGLDYETLKKVNPHLVMTSITNFGQTGPYRDWKGSELTLFAQSGQMYKIGDPDREPLKHALNVVQYYAGKIAGIVTVAAAMSSAARGYGEYIDLSIFEIMACDIDNAVINYDYTGDKGQRKTARNYNLYPWGGFPAKDGYVAIQGTNRVRWESRLFAMIDKPDPKYDETERAAHNDEVNAMLNAWLTAHTKDEIGEKAGKVRYPLAPVFTTEELVKDRHYRERGYFVEIEHPAAGKLTYPGAPFKMSEAGFAVRQPAPLLGQHNEEVYCGLLGYSKHDLAMLRSRDII